MKIGIFTDSYLPVVHGVEVSVESFRKQFENLGNDVYVYAPSAPGYKDKNKKVFRLESLRVVKNPEMRFAFPLVRQGSLRQITDFRLDIVHAQTPFSLGLMGKYIAARQKIPIIYTHHTDYPHYAKSYFHEKFILPEAAKIWTMIFSNMSDAVVAPSKKVKSFLQKMGVIKPIYVISTGINTNLFRPSAKTGSKIKNLRDELKISPEEKILIFVGRLGEEKNVEFLIRSFKLMERSEKKISFVVAGTGPALKKLKMLAKKLGVKKILFAGRVEHELLPIFYQMADLFIFSSHTETQGLVILESLASGTPVVVLNDAAFQGIVNDGRNGIIIQRDNEKEFAKNVLQLIGNKRKLKKMGESGIKTAEKFSEEIQAEKMLALYKHISISKKAEK